MTKEIKPFKLMGSPGAGLLSPGSDIALVAALLNFAGDDVKVWFRFCPDDMWQALDSLAHDAPKELMPTFATPPLKIFWAEKIEGFAAAICKLEAAVAAIFNLYNLKEKSGDLRDRWKLQLILQKNYRQYFRNRKAKIPR